MLRKEEVIGIFSVWSLEKDVKGRKFLNELRVDKRTKDISRGKWSSVVLTDGAVYISRISSGTLQSRTNAGFEEMLLTDDDADVREGRARSADAGQ